MNSAGQGVRPRPAYSNAQHAVERRNSSPQSGGDIGGPRAFLAGKGIPTSGGTAKPGAKYTTDRTNDQGGKRLYLGKAYENAQRPPLPFYRGKGNSEGVSEVHTNTVTDVVSRGAKARITKGNANDRVATGDEYSSQPIRRESNTFGPVRQDRQTVGRDHQEHQRAAGRRMERGGVRRKEARSGG